MRHNTIFFVLLFIAFSFNAASQRRARIEQVTAGNQIKGSPYLILPQTAVKFKFSVFEYTYSPGPLLRDYISIVKTCTDDQLKVLFKPLEDQYGINAAILIELLRRDVSDDKTDLVKYKMDKEIKTSFISMADYTKVFKYVKLRSPLSSGLLSLEYDENGVLISSKQTEEPKLVSSLLSFASGFASIVTATAKGAGVAPTKTDVNDPCATIKHTLEAKLDKYIDQYTTYLGGSGGFTVNHAVKALTKFEEDIAKGIFQLFYSREVKAIPLEMTFILPRDQVPGDKAPKKLDLFSFDKSNSKIIYDVAYASNLHVTPIDRFDGRTSVPTPYTVELALTEGSFNKQAGLANLLGGDPDKKTAVYNIPKSERFRLNKPGGPDAFIDTVIKVPQHGQLGYYSLKLSSLELAYDINGELKKISLERKSPLDNTASGLTAVKDLATAFKKDEKTDLEKLEERTKTLELLKKIEELEREN